MYLEIEKLIERLNYITELRLNRAVEGMSDAFRQVYTVLPLLLHFNHTALPGYREDAPHGICQYQPSSLSLLASFNFDFMSLAVLTEQRDILGLYSMGSTSSLGQSPSSDLDIWVCIDQQLSKTRRQFLREKCHLIELWAESYGIDLFFFIVDENRFKDCLFDDLDDENCGSAQHILLLEEFYRTATKLAGKHLLWYVVPVDMDSSDNNYEQQVALMCQRGMITREEWVDFGPLTTLSSAEYFGASLWQIYKSIDSPYKSVLKAILIESYTYYYPKTKLLASQIKAHFQRMDSNLYYFDNFEVLLEHVTDYLEEIGDESRLDLARRCFYIKTQEKLSQSIQIPSWKRQCLMLLVNKWQWSKEMIVQIDQRLDWKISEVSKEHDILLNTIMISYRNLLDFGRRNNLDSLVSPRDAAILTRKLYATYEVLPDKVNLLNTHIANDLAEAYLTFIYVDEFKVNRNGWYVYNRQPTFNSIIGNQPLEYHRCLVKLVAWSYFNGLFVPHTEIFLKNDNRCTLEKLQHLVADITDYFPIHMLPATEDALYNPCEIRKLAIFINLEADPTKYVRDNGTKPLSMNVLNYGLSQISLIGSVDLLYTTSWNEVKVLHFEGWLCVLDALKSILGKMHKDADIPDSIKIFCYSARFQTEIKTQLDELIKECVTLRLSTTEQNAEKFKSLQVAGITWGMFFERLGVSIHQFDNAIDFYGAISNNKLTGTALNSLNEPSQQLPFAIDGVASEGIIQFFFEDTSTGFNLYILNESNQVEIYYNCNGNKENVVRYANHFYTLTTDRLTINNNMNFNYPQFYQLVEEGDKKRVLPFYYHQQES